MGLYYRFGWIPSHPSSKPAEYDEKEVVSYCKEDMMLFLMQHGFDTRNPRIEILDDAVESVDSDALLHEYTFGSKKRDRMYRIMTTKEIMNSVMYETTGNLTSCMSFGSCALRGDIQIFEKISELINGLEYGGITEENLDKPVRDYCPTDVENIESEQTDIIYTILDGDTHPSRDIQPYTIEWYVRIFTEMYILGRG